MKSLKIGLRILGVIAIILTLFPFIPIEHWTIRIFDFPHLQLTLFTMFALLTYFLAFDFKNKYDYVFVAILTACFLFQGMKIYPYTAFAKYEVQDASSNPKETLSTYTANVLQENKDMTGIINDAEQFEADILLFTETNEKWISSLSQNLGDVYRHKIEVPKDNTYGMLLMSKFPLEEKNVKYLVEDSIPSIHVKVVIPSGKKIQVFAIHPAPPSPKHNPTSVDRDAELMKIADLSRNSNFPVIVMGDFNDVAWSETTSLFQNFSGLLDLRKGRGFYSTYNAKSWIMRWPLDHIFTSADFRVLDVQLGDKTGSDHFPFFTKLSLEPDLALEQRLPPPSKEEIKKALDQIGEENKTKDDVTEK